MQGNIEEYVRGIIRGIEGSIRPDLEETPRRVQTALTEMLDGYSVDIDSLFKTFEGEGQDQIVVIRNIKFTSFCEHHLLPFSGTAHVAYLPVKKVIGASKIPRLVMAYAHRLQLQERITRQVAETLMEKLEPQGVAVVIQGEHTCMRCRGIKCSDSQMVTSVMLGQFRIERTLRLEVLTLLGLGEPKVS